MYGTTVASPRRAVRVSWPASTGTTNTSPRARAHRRAATTTAALRPRGAVSTFPVYSHGFSLRLRLTATHERIAAGLAALGLSQAGKKRTWIDESTACRSRWVMRGSVWLSGRSPRNKRLPLRAFNIEHGTHLYVLAVERDARGTYVDVSGVRDQDPYTVLEEAMGLTADEHEVAYWRQLERYVVLSPPDAHRLADALGAEPVRGRGRLARKEYLVRDHEVPVVFGVRRHATAVLSVYRVVGGATAPYRAELVVRGRRADPTHLREEDGVKLEAALRAIVAEHGLDPLPKPSRWEPFDPDDQVTYDPDVGRLHAGNYRGRKPKTPTDAECHTPLAIKVWEAPPSTVDIDRLPPDAGVSATSRDDGVVRGRGDEGSLHHSPSPRTPYTSLVDELVTLPDGFISEVILDGDVPPHRVVSSLLDRSPETHVLYLGLDGAIPLPLMELMVTRSTNNPEAETVVLVVDPLVPSGVVSAMLEDLRPAHERDGGHLVLITCDRRGTWRPHPRDARSTVASARFYAHMRYRAAGPGRWVALKDERHGRAGRSVGSPHRRS